MSFEFGATIRKDSPTPSQLHTNTPLTNVSVAYMQDPAGFIADRVFPAIPVNKQSDIYYTYDRSYWFRSDAQKRTPGAETAGTDYGVGTDNYYADVWGLHVMINEQQRANADSVFQLDREATELLSGKILLLRELQWASTFFAGGIWTGGDVDGVAGTPGAGQVKQWNDAASTPIEDVTAAMTAVQLLTGKRPNKFVMGRQVLDQLKNHPDIIDRVKYGQTAGGPARISLAALEALFEVEQILVMEAIQNTAAEGASLSNAFIGGKKALLVYAEPSPGLMKASGGYTMNWRGYMGAGAGGQRIQKFVMPLHAADRIQIETAFVQKLVAPDMGYFFDTIVA